VRTGAETACSVTRRVGMSYEGVAFRIAPEKRMPPGGVGGGAVAGGEQWTSWVNLEDHVGIFLLAIDGYAGALNSTAPNPVKNRDFTRALAAAVHRPAVIPAPAFGIKLLFGEGASIVTEGQRVLPEAALAAGYCFRHPEITEACADLV